MPKTLILTAPSAAARADALAEAARGVRFAEVDVRPLPPAAALADSLAGYDAVLVGGSSAEVASLLQALPALGDTVGSAFGGDDDARWATLRALAERGAIIVPPNDDADAHGRRVATVAEWVRHAKSHRHEHNH